MKLFSDRMLKRHPEERRDGRATAEATRWHELDEFDLKISLTPGAHMVRVFLRGEAEAKPEPKRKRLEPFQSELEAKLGVPMKSDERSRFFIDRLDIDVTDESNWDMAADDSRLGATIKEGKRYILVRGLKIDTDDRANWDRMADWLHQEAGGRRACETRRRCCARLSGRRV